MTQLCEIPRCRLTGRHLPGCDDDCRGCLPRATDDGHACAVCVGRTAAKLEVIADLTEPARLVAAGLVRRGEGGNSGKPGSRPPLNDGATDALNDVQNRITTICRDIAETRGLHFVSTAFEGHRVSDPLVEACSWLSDQLGWVRHAIDGQGQPYAADVFAEIADCVSRMRSIVDGPAAKRYLGPCGATLCSLCGIVEANHICEGDIPVWTCDGDIYGRIWARNGICRTCGALHDQEKRRIWLDGQTKASDLTWTAINIADALNINVKTLRSWATERRAPNGVILRRAKLATYWDNGTQLVPWVDPQPGEDVKKRGDRLHYVADVMALAEQAAQEREQRTAAKAEEASTAA